MKYSIVLILLLLVIIIGLYKRPIIEGHGGGGHSSGGHSSGGHHGGHGGGYYTGGGGGYVHGGALAFNPLIYSYDDLDAYYYNGIYPVYLYPQPTQWTLFPFW
jgi:hypothetical protein